MVAFQTAPSPEEAKNVWKQLGDSTGKLTKGQVNLRRVQYADFAFIAAYTFLFFSVANLGRQRPIAWSRIAGTLAMVSTVVTAAADIGENLFTLENVAAVQSRLPGEAQVALMRHCSLTKWAALGVTLVLFWWVFLPSRRGSALYRLLALTIAAFSLIGGSVGILGLWDITKLELVIPFLAPALLLQIPLFWRYWDDVLGAHSAVISPPIEAWEVTAG
ncbi:MAG TPA: hypothetical protein VKF84_11530 [Candidatus Sulfotelmatobacter sp.]|nr:hypothetical protein [Candidatus Sulfotelmatobacter sp.]